MTRHLLYLLHRDLHNRIRRQATRLRRPRYAIAVLVGVAYFYFAFGGFMSDPGGDGVAAPLLGFGRTAGPVAIALFAAWWWLWGGHREALKLSPAETHMLLPAPLTRRQIIQLKVMQAQVGLLFSAGIATLLLRGSALPWPVRLLSIWVMVATLQLHQVAASLVHASAESQGRHGLRRQVVPLALFGAAFVTLVISIGRALTALRGASSMEGAVAGVAAALDETGPRIVLAPFRAVLAPIVAGSFDAWLTAFGVAFALLLLHYVWVLRTDAAFEEAAAAAGARHAELAEAVRAGGLSRVGFMNRQQSGRLARPWLPLQPVGFAAYAVFWKNVLFVQRLLRPFTIVLMLVFVSLFIMLGVSEAETVRDGLRNAGFILASFAGLASLVGPIGFRNDLRMDLQYVDLLRTYPLAGRDVVAAGIAAASASLSALQIPLIAISCALIAASGTAPVWLIAVIFAVALVATPIINTIGVCTQNAIALLYPGWVRLGEASGAGMEVMGQNIITFVGSVLLLLLALIPALLVGGGAAAVFGLQSPVLAAAAGTAGALVTLAVEIVVITLWLGRLYDSTDPVVAGLLTH